VKVVFDPREGGGDKEQGALAVERGKGLQVRAKPGGRSPQKNLCGRRKKIGKYPWFADSRGGSRGLTGSETSHWKKKTKGGKKQNGLKVSS